jgi:hypothetical protein
MDSQKMDVGDWQNSPLPVVLKARARQRFLPPTLIGILGTALLHVMLIGSVSFGTRGPKSKPPETQEFASALSKFIGEPESLVLISLPMIANANQTATRNLVSSLSALSKMKINPKIDIDSPVFASLEIFALNDDPTPSATAGGAVGAEQARMFGIYTGQIQARIDRVWRRPRTPVTENLIDPKRPNADESFQCEAQIVQDSRGNVREILLPRCNGSAAWQRSLVLAIQQASPLPAPPSVTVFNKSISLQFVGLPYISGSSEDGYEIETTRIARE